MLPQVVDGIEIALTSSFAVEALRDHDVALACDLYTDSFFEKSVAARFIALVVALEVLKDKDLVSSEAIRLVDDWLGKLGKLGDEEAESFGSQLKHMKQLSIGRGIGRVVARHLGKERAREAQKLYRIRSSFVHRGERPADLRESLELTQLVVRELLIKILQLGLR